MYWLAAEEITNITEINGEPAETTLSELVGNNGFTIEYEDDELYLPNLCNANEFSINGQSASLIGGVHSPQRPK